MYNQKRVPLKRRPIEIKPENEADSFLGIGKKAKARKTERVAIRNEKKRSKIESRSYKKKVKADSLAKRYSGKAEAGIIAATGEAEANKILAQQGVIGNPVQQRPDTGQQLLNTASGLLGGENGNSYGVPEEVEEYTEEQLSPSQLGIKDTPKDKEQQGKKSNTMLYIIIAVVVIAGIMYFKKK